MQQPRFVISGLSGGSGKTLVSLGLSRFFSTRGLVVQACKKGPDYIDYAWLALAARRPAACLDPYFLDDAALLRQFIGFCRSHPSDMAVIEGNRGLFDGRDLEGTCSTAHVARLLKAPVILTMNCAKMTRTAAAVVSGMARFEPELHLAGVILNNVAGSRHGLMLRRSIERYTDIPVLGILPRLRDNPLPERHMGLSLDTADDTVHAVLDHLADVMRDNVDTERVLALGHRAPELPDMGGEPETLVENDSPRPRIGYVRDRALWFYYEENLDALHDAGADLIRLDMFDDNPWPPLDGLYLGGGYPELFADRLSQNKSMLQSVAEFIHAGGTAYAECGGMLYLGRSLALSETAAPQTMANALPVRFAMDTKRRGLGYRTARLLADSCLGPAGTTARGHEFHYSYALDGPAHAPLPAPLFAISNRENKDLGTTGYVFKNTAASYIHLHFGSCPGMAEYFVAYCASAQK